MTVADGATRQAILGLRNDPNVASLMAAEHASDNKAALESALGRPVTGTDLYMAPFLGLGGARSFLSTMASDPDRGAASIFPAAARAQPHRKRIVADKRVVVRETIWGRP